MSAVIQPPSPIRAGLVETIEAAGIGIAMAPDGWHVSDATAAQNLINSYVGSAAELQYHRTQKLAALAVEYLGDGASVVGKIGAGFNYTGPDGVKRNFQIDPPSQANLDAMSNAALGAILNSEAWSSSFFWVASDNTQMALSTAAAMRAFGVAAKNYVGALFATYQAIRSQINIAATAASVDAIDVTQGWPAN